MPVEARHWEQGTASVPLGNKHDEGRKGDVSMGESVELDEPAGLERLRIEYLKKAVLGDGQGSKTRDQRAGDRFSRSRGNSSDGFE